MEVMCSREIPMRDCVCAAKNSPVEGRWRDVDETGGSSGVLSALVDGAGRDGVMS